ncbi:MAG: hypothetical protein RL127_1704, partial [Bacteroidota bacterium]
MKRTRTYFGAVILFLLLASTSYQLLFRIEPMHRDGSNPKLDKIRVQPGFKLEHLISPSDEHIGSWVSMTFDDRGRMICSDQYGGLFRVTVPPLGTNTKPVIEKLKFGKGTDTLGIGNAHGLLYAFKSIYV